jgi:hypothetical protein
MGAELSVDFLNQPYLIDDASHDTEMVDVLNLNPKLLSMFVDAPRISQLAGLTCGMWDSGWQNNLARNNMVLGR